MSDQAVIELAAGDEVAVRAAYVGERIHPPLWSSRLASNPAIYEIGENQVAVVFRYGVVVFFNATPELEKELLDSLGPHISAPFDTPEDETATLVASSEVAQGFADHQIRVSQATTPHLQSIADVLAKSVTLAHYEQEMASAFEAIEPMATGLRSGRAPMRTSKLLEHIGSSLEIRHRMVGRVEVREKPELLWELPELDRFYLRLADEFELHQRSVALERKLELISTTAETLLELIQARRSLRVEWYIVFLILVEIVITLVEHLV